MALAVAALALVEPSFQVVARRVLQWLALQVKQDLSSALVLVTAVVAVAARRTLLARLAALAILAAVVAVAVACKSVLALLHKSLAQAVQVATAISSSSQCKENQ